MRKLLRADLSRLFRDKVFLLSCAVMFIAGTGLPLLHYFDNLKNGEGWTVDSTCFGYAFLVPILLSLVTALFVGTGYSDGTMRNKLIVGHRRNCIYLSGLITCIAAGFMLCFSYLVPHTAFGFLLLGKSDAGAAKLLIFIGLNFALTAVFAALSVLISILCRNKAYSTAGCILLVFALLFAGIRITSALNEPEYYSGYSYTENGSTITEEAERNPNYLHGTKRQIYEFLNDFIPGGQAIKLANMNAEKPALPALYDGIILLAATGFGMVFFRRRDLK